MAEPVKQAAPIPPREIEVAPDDQAMMADAAAALGVVIRLFDRELDGEAIDVLAAPQTRDFLAGLVESAPAREALGEFTEALNGISAQADEAELDLLAADYADIFLTHGHRAAPSASVWLSDDHTERNDPMFNARAWYDHWGIKVPNWRIRADDHIVSMLQFIQALLEPGEANGLVDVAVFMDTQMGPWVGDFLGRVAQRADTALYRASAVFAATLLAEIRAELARVTGIVEDIPEPPERPEIVPDEAAFIPGAAPSW